jgi:hypothetical protein
MDNQSFSQDWFLQILFRVAGVPSRSPPGWIEAAVAARVDGRSAKKARISGKSAKKAKMNSEEKVAAHSRANDAHNEEPNVVSRQKSPSAQRRAVKDTAPRVKRAKVPVVNAALHAISTKFSSNQIKDASKDVVMEWLVFILLFFKIG